MARIGEGLKRSRAEIDSAIQKLRYHWVGTLSDWKSLSSDARRQVALPLLLQHKLDELAAASPSTEGDPCVLIRTSSTLCCQFDGYYYELPFSDSLGAFLLQMKGDNNSSTSSLYAEDNKKVDQEIPISLSLFPGRKLIVGDSFHTITAGYPLSAMDQWLKRLGMEKYCNLFYHESVDDFFTVPFLRADVLERIGIANADDRRKIMDAVRDIRSSPSHFLVAQWLEYLGYESCASTFIKEQIDLHGLLSLREADLNKLIPDVDIAAKIIERIDHYARFSSVEETFRWLQTNGFEKYSFHFARYNIPFYALPFVNFFIINEIGVTTEDQKLLNALQKLKDSPAYNVKGVAYWLRDLEMEKYNLIFANNLLFSLETLTVLNDSDIDRLVSTPSDREKMRLGIQEMKEFQFYYSATASLLQELGMERYSELFAHHGISIDILPFLSDGQLKEMGISNASDRDKIMTVVRKLQSYIPLGPTDEPKGGLKKGSARRTTSRRIKTSPLSKEIPSRSQDIRSVEEWLAFINNTDNDRISTSKSVATTATVAPKSPSKKTKKKKRRARATPLPPHVIAQTESDEKTAKVNEQIMEVHELLKEATETFATASKSGVSLTTTSTNRTQSSIAKSSSSNTANSPNALAVTTKTSNREYATSSPLTTTSKRGGLETSNFPEDEFEDDDDMDMDPDLKAKLDKEVEEFRLRLESVNQYSKSKLTPLFYLPD